MKELKEIVQLSKQFVRSRKKGRPNHEVELFLASKLGFSSRLDLYLHYDRPLTEEELSMLRPGLKRLAEGEPVAYILGVTEFYGFPFFVSQDVLIPRPETELMVDLAISWIDSEQKKKESSESIRCLDLCAGSGCIGISLKKKKPEITVDAIDISLKALKITKKNAEYNDVAIQVIHSDLFSSLDSSLKYDLIVSNPPYLSVSEFQELDSSVRDYEPEIALIGGISGIEMYEKIAENLHRFLVPGGLFLCEIGSKQKKELIAVFQKYGFSSVGCYQDYQGRDRILHVKQE